MPFAAAAVVGAAAVGAYASNKASKKQAQSARDANDLQREIADEQTALQREQYNKNIELNQPVIDARNSSLSRLQQLMGLTAGGADNGSAMRDFGTADFQSDPGYAFQLAEGQKAQERSAAARGGLLSGGAVKDSLRFSQGLASQDYQNAFNRFQTNRSNKLNSLQSLAGLGQTAANSLSNAGQNMANGIGSALGNYGAAAGANITGAGNARASGYVGAANAIGNGLSQGYNMYQSNQLMNQMNNQGSGYVGDNGYYADNDLFTS